MQPLKVPALIENTPISDDFVQGIARIERLGPCLRVVLFVDDRVEGCETTARVVVRKIVVPLDVVPGALKQVADFLALQAVSVVSNVLRLSPR